MLKRKLKIIKLKKLIKEGEYQINERRIAQKMINNSLKNNNK